jgi:hypothetical protein
MKRIIIIFILSAAAGAITIGQETGSTPFMNLSGFIDKRLEIQMVLYREDSALSGSYVYTKFGSPLSLKGTIDSGQNIILTEFDKNGKRTGMFKGTLTGEGKLEGNWSDPDGSKTMPFLLESFNLDGCYIHQHTVPVMGKDDWEDFEVTNRLSIKKEDPTQLKFSVHTVSTNAHLCHAEGTAVLVRDVYEYRPEDCPECILKIKVKADKIEIEDVNFACYRSCGYCGARGSLDAEFLFSEKESDIKKCITDPNDMDSSGEEQ